MLNTSRALIDLAALRNNLAVVRSLCPDSRVMAMVKADAYGHGLTDAAKALPDADGFAVARLDEALQLRRAGVQQRILLLGTLLDEADLQLCSAQQIDVTAHDRATVTAIEATAPLHPLRVWLKLDSGMHRLGLSSADFVEAEQRLRDCAGIIELSHLTHLSSAEDLDSHATEVQLQAFDSARGASSAVASIANSAAIIARPPARREWVRPGIMLYGVNPFGATHTLPLQPVMSLRANVLSVRAIARGDSVGYNRAWTAQRDSTIAAIGIGYGDGYPRHAPNGTPIWLNGHLARLAGRVSMDTITVDVTDIADVQTGDEAILWGKELSVETVAKHAGTISYELLTAIGHRVPRVYVN
jgi:alanine racemase